MKLKLVEIGLLDAIPLTCSVALAILFVTKTMTKEINLTIMTTSILVAFSFFKIGLFEWTVSIIVSTVIGLIFFSVFRSRKSCSSGLRGYLHPP